MKFLNNLFRKRINKINKKRLQNTSFSLIASNCNGALICHDLGVEFNSPFVNLWIPPDDFVRYLGDIEYYNSCELSFKKESGIDYPVGILGDIVIYFQHYNTEEEAKQKWEERLKRMNLDNLFVLFTDRDGCTHQNLKDFDALPYKNKVVFTHKEYDDIKSAFYIKGFESEASVGRCFEFLNAFTGKKRYDDFDYVAWFNGELAGR